MRDLGTVDRLWRYPVKSLRPEELDCAQIEPGGIPGDRAAALFVNAGHARAGKTYRGKEHNLLHTVQEAQAAQRLAAERGVDVEVRSSQTHYFDDAPISIVFDVWIAEVERALETPLDPQRWRPNVYARASAGFAYREEDLLGTVIEAGTAVLRVRDRIGRCVTTTYDVATGEPDNDVLLYVAQRRGNTMGIYCDVELAGVVRPGEVLRLRER